MVLFKLYNKETGFEKADIAVKLDVNSESGWISKIIFGSAEDQTLRYLKLIASLLAPWNTTQIDAAKDAQAILIFALKGLEWVYFCTQTFGAEIESDDAIEHVKSAARKVAPSKVLDTIRTTQENMQRGDPNADTVTKSAADTVMSVLKEESKRLNERIEAQKKRLTTLQERKKDALNRVLSTKQC